MAEAFNSGQAVRANPTPPISRDHARRMDSMQKARDLHILLESLLGVGFTRKESMKIIRECIYANAH
jgi:hypothetical protein